MNEHSNIDFDALSTNFEEEKPQITESQLEELPFEDWEALAAVSGFNFPSGGKLLAFLNKHELNTITNATSLWIQEQISLRARGENASLTTYKERMMDTGYTVSYEEVPRGFYISKDEESFSVGPSPLNHSPTSGKIPRDGHKFMVALTVSSTYIKDNKFVAYEGFAKSADIKLPEEFSVKSVGLFVSLLEKLRPKMSYCPKEAEGNTYIDFIDREYLAMKDNLFYPLQDVTLKYFFPTLSKTKLYGDSFKPVGRALEEGQPLKVLLSMVKPFKRLKVTWPKLTYLEVIRFLAASRTFRGQDNKGLSALTAGYQVGGLPSKEAKRVVNVLRLALPFMLQGRQVEVVLSSIGDMAGVERGLSAYAANLRHLLHYRMTTEDRAKVDKMWKDRVTVTPIPAAVLLLMAGTASVSAKKNDEVQNLSHSVFRELREGHRLYQGRGSAYQGEVGRDPEDEEEKGDIIASIFGNALDDEETTQAKKKEESPPEQVATTGSPDEAEVEKEVSSTRDFILYMKVQCDQLFSEYYVYPGKSSHAMDAYVSNMQLSEAYVNRHTSTPLIRTLSSITAPDFLNLAMRHNYERNTAFLYAFVWADYTMNFWVPRKRTHQAKLEFEFGEEEEVDELPTEVLGKDSERDDDNED